nr:MAG TPA: minor tail protein [Caudoviricetes sp.]
MGLRKFPDIRTFAWKSTKTQRWNTEVRRSGSGQVRTMTTWTYPQWEITAQFVHLTIDEYKKIMGFFALLKGGTEPFLWLDPEDYEEKNVPLVRQSDGYFYAFRKWGDYAEPVEYIKDVTVYANGERIGARAENGRIILSDSVDSSAKVTADYTYYWKVMLAGKSYSAEYIFRNFYKTKCFKLVTVK